MYVIKGRSHGDSHPEVHSVRYIVRLLRMNYYDSSLMEHRIVALAENMRFPVNMEITYHRVIHDYAQNTLSDERPQPNQPECHCPRGNGTVWL